MNKFNPLVTVTSEKVKMRFKDPDSNRHFFTWTAPKVDRTIALRLQLLDQAGKVIVMEGGHDCLSFQLKPGVSPILYADADQIAYGYQYWTYELIRGASTHVINTISNKVEDLVQHNINVAQIEAEREKL